MQELRSATASRMEQALVTQAGSEKEVVLWDWDEISMRMLLVGLG